MKSELLQIQKEGSISRRDFARKIGIGGATLAGATMFGSVVTSVLEPKALAQNGNNEANDTLTASDIDILNFALNLEYLEAEFYYIASFGVTIEAAGVIPKSAVSGPTRAPAHMVPNFASSDVAYLASALREDEVQHVLFLRKALGSAAVRKPTIDLTPLATGLANDEGFIIAAATLEPVGTSAYLGAAPLITSKSVLDAAARIGFTEAQHAGAMRTEAIRRGFTVHASDGADVVPTPNKPFFVDPTGLTIPRTPQEVLAIVKPFFPDGLNGNIK